ncbi:4-hydroxybenzoate polyprenyltransferase [Methanolobus vulcani]|uniref:4-hydroxybenzoate polyprenyltransferase n=1 Tax=Methanolobus vulcani TaxID=38026 RepID=A0A7Z7FEW5_9EURY|nr:UbiA family prenyltransferase [Methanolobus vulcani]SDG10292.1 4-hydroxybenzoate polyprenyltransferase [Methanolobus vulcani]
MSSNCTIGLPGFSVKKYEQKYNLPRINPSPTVNLLKSSVLVSFSGALRIHIAFLLLHIQSVFLNCLAGGLIIYAVYTLDRALDSEEDLANRPELKGASKKTALIISLICFLAGAAILTVNGLIFFAFLPLVTGYLYSKGAKIGKFNLKLKGGLGMKNIVVGTTWGAFIAGIAGIYAADLLAPAIVFLYFGLKLFVNSAIYDFKDIKGDTLAGIKTLPVVLGQKKAKIMLFSLHILSHMILLLSIITGTLAFEPIILGYSFIIGLLYIKSFAEPVNVETKNRLARRLFMIDGESTTIVGLRTIASGLIA